MKPDRYYYIKRNYNYIILAFPAITFGKILKFLLSDFIIKKSWFSYCKELQ